MDETEDKIRLQKFGQPAETFAISEIVSDDKGYGHGGGDGKLVDQLYDILAGNVEGKTSFEASVESHLMGICAEESRLKGGELIYIHK